MTCDFPLPHNTQYVKLFACCTAFNKKVLHCNEIVNVAVVYCAAVYGTELHCTALTLYFIIQYTLPHGGSVIKAIVLSAYIYAKNIFVRTCQNQVLLGKKYIFSSIGANY